MKKPPPRRKPPRHKRKKRPNPAYPPDTGALLVTAGTRILINLFDHLLDRMGVPKPKPGAGRPMIEPDNAINLKKGRDFDVIG